MDDTTADDRRFMLEALALGARPPRRPWPNPPVGAVMVRDGVVVGRGAHAGAGTPHAEAVALADAGTRAKGAILYCTFEPCNHQGRTPPCAGAIVSAGVSRLVVAIRDPNPRVAGGGLEAVRAAGIPVTSGVCAEEALDLAWPFVVTRAFERPFVWLKTAVSLDGRFAPAGVAPGSGPVYLTGEAARRQAHVLRRWADVVLVGSRTATLDRPRLDGRLASPGAACPPEDPTPAVMSARLAELPPWPGRRHLAFVGRGVPASGRNAIGSPGGVAVPCEVGASGVEPSSVVAALRELGHHCLLVEGGPSVAAAFLEAGLVDRWIRYTAPVVLGRGVGWPEWGGERGLGGPRPLEEGPRPREEDGRPLEERRHQPEEGPRPLGGGRPPGEGPRGAASFTLTRAGCCGADAVSVWDRLPFAATCARLAGGGAGTAARGRA